MAKDMLSVPATERLSVSGFTVVWLIKAERLKAHRKTHAPQSPFMIDRASVAAYERARRGWAY